MENIFECQFGTNKSCRNMNIVVQDNTAYTYVKIKKNLYLKARLTKRSDSTWIYQFSASESLDGEFTFGIINDNGVKTFRNAFWLLTVLARAVNPEFVEIAGTQKKRFHNLYKKFFKHMYSKNDDLMFKYSGYRYNIRKHVKTPKIVFKKQPGPVPKLPEGTKIKGKR